jgi:hypothetical protein
MARKDVMEIYNSFNAEQKQFVETKKLEANFKLKKWLELLENVAIMDSYADETIKKLNKLKWIFGILGIILLILSFIIMAGTTFGALFLLIPISFFILCYINYSRQQRFKQFDLSNGLRLFTIPLMKILREETNKENPIEMKLDFNNPLTNVYLLKTINHVGNSYPKVDTYIYQHPWISASTKLNDEVGIDWNITDMLVKKHIKKISSSGKIKTKNKIKIKHSLRLAVTFPKANFKLIETQKNLVYVDKDECHTFKLKGKTFSETTDTTLEMNYFLNAIATSFKCVQPIKA